MLFKDEYSELIYIAGEDLESAKILANHYKPQIEVSCYHCQQCVEKVLKAFLSFHNVKFRYIHNLKELCRDCQNIDASFSIFQKECEVLTKYITETRYSRQIQLTEHEMKQAILSAEKILDFVKKKTILVKE